MLCYSFRRSLYIIVSFERWCQSWPVWYTTSKSVFYCFCWSEINSWTIPCYCMWSIAFCSGYRRLPCANRCQTSILQWDKTCIWSYSIAGKSIMQTVLSNMANIWLICSYYTIIMWRCIEVWHTCAIIMWRMTHIIALTTSRIDYLLTYLLTY